MKRWKNEIAMLLLTVTRTLAKTQKSVPSYGIVYALTQTILVRYKISNVTRGRLNILPVSPQKIFLRYPPTTYCFYEKRLLSG